MAEVARTGDVLANGATIDAFSTAGSSTSHFLADNGRAAFEVTSAALGGKVIVSGVGGSPTVFRADGDPLAGATLGETIKNIKIWGYTDSGTFVYSLQSFIPPGSTGFQEFWRNAERLAWNGHAFGTGMANQFTRGWVSETGDLLVSGTVTPASWLDPSYIAWFRPFEGELLAKIDELTPGPNGSTFALGVYAGGVFWDRQLDLAFASNLNGVPYTEDHGIFFGTGVTPVELLRKGDAGPNGGAYAALDIWDFNDHNQSLVWAQWRVDGDTTWYDELLRISQSGIATRIAAEGEPDPNTTGLFGNFSEGAMNDAGEVAFLGIVKVAGTSYNALLVWDGQSLWTLAQEGQTFDGQILTSVGFAGRVGNYINRSALNTRGQVAFVANSTGQNAVYRYDPITSVDVPPTAASRRITLESVSPNPFNPRTTLVYSLAAPTHVTVVVHDLAGRVVRKLMDEIEAAGPHRIVWDGVDDGGRAVASGAYLVRISGADEVQTAKLSLLK
ncbi:MAG: FlgD immunoglobulin-like domain containing protein [Candidatus Krumholzibacteria bacterium]|nr:FlgD immunoglobulin-like domain containing protein [Candidatus Krumholzibacteria bacterium]